EKGLTLAEEYGPNAVLMGDRLSLEQAALNLLENAVKYTPNGGSITLQTARTDGVAMLAVVDTGPGIPPEHAQRLGERFFRVDAAASREAGGAGLGLAIASGIAAAHGGEVRIESASPHGTRATLRLAVGGPGS